MLIVNPTSHLFVGFYYCFSESRLDIFVGCPCSWSPKKKYVRKPSPCSAICGWSGCPFVFSYPTDQLFCWPRQTIACCTLVKVLPGWKLLCLLYIEIEVKERKKHLPKADLNDPGNAADLKLETGKFPLQASRIEMVSHVSALVPIRLPREIWDQTQSPGS